VAPPPSSPAEPSEPSPPSSEPAASPPGPPLAGILVADFSRVLAGPYATMLLADLGAEVVKVERPGHGDDTRAWGPPYADGVSTYFRGVNRGKRSVAWDLATAEGLAAARDLVRRADVLVENFRPGSLDRLGLGWEAVSALNPRLVYCSVTGFGAGPGAAMPGYDLLVQAVGGLMSVTGPDAEHPTKVGVALVDVVTGLHAVTGILAALRYRDATGQGQRIEVELLTSLLSALVNQVSGYLDAGVVPGPMGNRHPSIAPYETLPAADGVLALAVGNDRQFTALCEEIGRPGLATDPRFATNPARVAHRGELADLLAEALAAAPVGEWVERLVARGVPCGPVNDVAAAVRLATVLGLDPVVDLPAGAGTVASRQVRHPVRYSATPPVHPSGPPVLPS
jgi:crotonobetainyl-CoA:carnitine CoA-transferase CaiB-like acyl-CoA transferase